jgi:hypothetical protein
MAALRPASAAAAAADAACCNCKGKLQRWGWGRLPLLLLLLLLLGRRVRKHGGPAYSLSCSETQWNAQMRR